MYKLIKQEVHNYKEVKSGGVYNYQTTSSTGVLQTGMDARLEELRFEPHSCKKDPADKHGWLNTSMCVPDVGTLQTLYARVVLIDHTHVH